MTLPASPNPISFSQINAELGQSSNAQISMGDSRVRATANLTSGAINANTLRGADFFSLFANKITGLNPDLTEHYTYVDGPVTDSLGYLYYAVLDSPSSTADTHILKMDQMGHIIWQKKFNSTYGGYIAISSSDEIYVNTSLSNLVKMDTSGNIVWQKDFADSFYTESLQQITTDSSGNVYFVTNGIMSAYNDRASWVYKLNSSGTVQWSRKIAWADTSDSTAYPGLSVSPSGDVVISCITNYNYSLYLTKFDSSGTLQFNNVSTGTTGNIFPTGIQQDSSGNIYITGLDDNLPFLTKLNSSGVTQWTRKLDVNYPSGFNGGYGGLPPLAIDSSNNLYFATLVCVKSDNTQFCYSVFKYNSSGTLQHYRRITLDTNAFFMNFYYISGGAYGPRLRVSRDGTKLDLMLVTYRDGSAYNCMELRIPSDSTTISAKTMSWGGNTTVATGSGFTDSAGTSYTWSASPLVVSSFTSTPTTPSNTTSAGALVIRVNALD